MNKAIERRKTRRSMRSYKQKAATIVAAKYHRYKKLFAVVADCLDGARFHCLRAKSRVGIACGLLCDIRATRVAHFEKAFRRGIAEGTTDALRVNIEFARNVKFIFF